MRIIANPGRDNRIFPFKDIFVSYLTHIGNLTACEKGKHLRFIQIVLGMDNKTTDNFI